ncbi:hypothetical protein BWI17_01960 [Betaproteobacteria bacterium GR16-43]|nr:hypothetical protein BWI17_01960 [Betaproteobacteria bacterium GR16-43]
MIPCVVLASGPREGLDFTDFKNEYYDFQPGVIRKFPYVVELHAYGAHDGGNGGGGEPGGAPMKPSLAKYERTFWDFKYHPGTRNPDQNFPPAMRFEICLPFGDLGHAAAFLKLHPAGIRLGRLFTHVQIVALSTPAFTGTILDENLTDAYRTPAHWIGA